MLNICVLTGNLGADPEISYTNNGDPIANFNLAFKSYKDKTGWIRVTAFNKLAEISQNYLTKGSIIFVSRILYLDKWQGNDGETRTSYKLLANSIEFIRGIKGGHNEEHQNAHGEKGEEEDLPF